MVADPIRTPDCSPAMVLLSGSVQYSVKLMRQTAPPPKMGYM